jgi:hypothetical protein
MKNEINTLLRVILLLKMNYVVYEKFIKLNEMRKKKISILYLKEKINKIQKLDILFI